MGLVRSARNIFATTDTPESCKSSPQQQLTDFQEYIKKHREDRSAKKRHEMLATDFTTPVTAAGATDTVATIAKQTVDITTTVSDSVLDGSESATPSQATTPNNTSPTSRTSKRARGVRADLLSELIDEYLPEPLFSSVTTDILFGSDDSFDQVN